MKAFTECVFLVKSWCTRKFIRVCTYVVHTYVCTYCMYIISRAVNKHLSSIFVPLPDHLFLFPKYRICTHTCVLCIGDLCRSCSTVPKKNLNLRIKTTESGYNGLPYIGLPFMCTKTRHIQLRPRHP